MNYKESIERIIEGYKTNPIDLLDIGEGENEYKYLNDLRYSYIRTVNDVVPLLAKGAKVLEIGALLGVVSIALKKEGFDVTATDIPEFHQSEKLQALYKSNGIVFDSVNLRNYKLPYPDEAFDAVIMCEVLEHLNFNPLPVIQEINRVLKKGGYIYVAMPNQVCIENRLKLLFGGSVHEPIQYFFNQLDRSKNYIASLHWREHTMKETREMLMRMGFVIKKDYFFGSNGPSSGLGAFIRKIFYIIPSLRVSIVAIGQKEQESKFDFNLTDANS